MSGAACDSCLLVAWYWSVYRLEALDPQGEGVDGPWELVFAIFYNDEAFNMVGRRLRALIRCMSLF